MSAQLLHARRFSVFVKGIPEEKFTIEEVNKFFSQFGQVINVKLDERKNAATIKFKEIVSAEKAHEFSKQQPIWSDSNIVLIYNVGQGGAAAATSDATSSQNTQSH